MNQPGRSSTSFSVIYTSMNDEPRDCIAPEFLRTRLRCHFSQNDLHTPLTNHLLILTHRDSRGTPHPIPPSASVPFFLPIVNSIIRPETFRGSVTVVEWG